VRTDQRCQHGSVTELQRAADITTIKEFVGNDIALQVQTAVPTGAARTPVIRIGSLQTVSGGITRADVTLVCRMVRIDRRRQHTDVAELQLTIAIMVVNDVRYLGGRSKTVHNFKSITDSGS